MSSIVVTVEEYDKTSVLISILTEMESVGATLKEEEMPCCRLESRHPPSHADLKLFVPLDHPDAITDSYTWSALCIVSC